MIILGVETSCDETAVSVVSGQGDDVKVLSNVVSSQIKIHEKYGGVVPEVAAREHVLNILPVVNEALRDAGIKHQKINEDKVNIDAIAVTVGPGLITSLISGIETAKSLAYAWSVPAISINHIEGHIYANFIKQKEKVKLPAIILTVSGGHTMLVLMKKHGEFETIGETRDDAAGEAFDKAAKMMNIGYPGGPAVSAYAEKARTDKDSKIVLPRPMINSGNYDFSFSGLKTALRYALKENDNWKNKISEYCHEFQQAIIDVLVLKTIKANREYSTKTIMLAGGVAANKELRKQLEIAVKKEGLDFLMPDLSYTTDNAAMIATAGYFKAKRKNYTQPLKLKVDCNFKL